jgi:hypothetical protein
MICKSLSMDSIQDNYGLTQIVETVSPQFPFATEESDTSLLIVGK